MNPSNSHLKRLLSPSPSSFVSFFTSFNQSPFLIIHSLFKWCFLVCLIFTKSSNCYSNDLYQATNKATASPNHPSYLLYKGSNYMTSVSASTNSASGNGGGGSGSISSSKFEPPSRPNSYWDEPLFRPYFDETLPRNITVQLGKTAHLPCQIRLLADRTVSWVRQRDLHILTVGRYTYTSDQRFTCVHLDDSDDWSLEIKYVQKEDAGVYECQASTEPKMSFSVRLNVVAAKAVIPEGPEVFVKSNSVISLTCIISDLPTPPAYVFWYHDGAVINYDSPRKGIKVTTEYGGVSTVSRLEITKARASDSGEYSCKPSYSDVANVTVHIITFSGAKQQAVLHAEENELELQVQPGRDNDQTNERIKHLDASGCTSCTRGHLALSITLAALTMVVASEVANDHQFDS